MLAIEMTYGSEARPDIKAHMSHIEAWLRYYDKYRTNESKKARMKQRNDRQKERKNERKKERKRERKKE